MTTISQDLSKHIWEGWTVGDFLRELTPAFLVKMDRLNTINDVKEWVMSNQPYYKKYIPEVVDFLWALKNAK